MMTQEEAVYLQQHGHNDPDYVISKLIAEIYELQLKVEELEKHQNKDIVYGPPPIAS